MHFKDWTESLTPEERASIKQDREAWDELEAKIERLSKDNERLREALASIAANTCCDKCQEAALVARSALNTEEQVG